MTLLSIDPGRSYKGEASIGWAVYTDGAGEWFRGYMSWEEIKYRFSLQFARDGQPWLRFDTQGTGNWLISQIVIEDFVNDPKSARGGQRNGTSECIGAVEILAEMTDTPFTRQRSDTLYAAKMHAPEGSWKKLKHLRHEDSAFLHGYEFLVRRGDIEVDLSATM